MKSFIEPRKVNKIDDIEKSRKLGLQRAENIKLLKTLNNIKAITAISNGLLNLYSVGIGLKKNGNSNRVFSKKRTFPSTKRFGTQRRFFFSSTKKKPQKMFQNKFGSRAIELIERELSGSVRSEFAMCFRKSGKEI